MTCVGYLTFLRCNTCLFTLYTELTNIYLFATKHRRCLKRQIFSFISLCPAQGKGSVHRRVLNSEEVVINEKSWKHSQRRLHLCKHEYLMCISGTKASLMITRSGFYAMLSYIRISDLLFIIRKHSLLKHRNLFTNVYIYNWSISSFQHFYSLCLRCIAFD